MPQIFISHSWANNAEALALRDWLVARGWDDLFLDIDPQRGLVSGQRWLDRLQANAQRCKAVLFVLSRAWLASRYCIAEFWAAREQERPLFAVVVDDTAVAEVPAEMRGVWQLAFLTRGSRFETFSALPPPDYVPTRVSFSHEGLESLRLGLVQAGLTSFDTTSFPWPAPGFEQEADGTTPRRPYRGLKPVDVPDAGVFFGRDADLVRARDHLADLRDRGGRSLVVLLGASGSGKSSFLRAGLLPRLARDDRRFLPLPVIRPRGAAMWGDDGLLAALETAHRQAGLTATRAALRSDLEAGGAAFLRRLADLRSAVAGDVSKDAKPPTLVVPIDQAEELFTTVRGDRPGETGAAEAGLFLARLAEILRHGPEALALATIRSDAYEPLQTAGELEGVPQVPFNLPPLAAAEYRSVIEGPAERVGETGRPLTLEPGLAAALLADAQGTDALPLLGFTLERLYIEHGGDRNLNRADYENLGGVRGSIEAALAEAFADPDAIPRIPADAAEREALLKRAFVPHLMGVNESNGEPVRRTARLADIPEAARGLISRLIDRRLLVIDRRILESGAEDTVVEVAHEALLRLWPTLRRWHDQESGALAIQQEVARASTAWSQNARGIDWLAHRGARLAEAEAVARREDFAAVFAGVPSSYLDECRKAVEVARYAEAQRLARQRTMQRRVGVLLLAVAVVTLLGAWLVMAGRRDLARQRSRLIAANAKEAFDTGYYDRAMRLALVANQERWLVQPSIDAEIELGRASHFSRLEAQLLSDKQATWFARFSLNGKKIVTDLGPGISIWSQGKDGTWTHVDADWHQGSLHSAAFSPDGTRIVTTSADKSPHVWIQGNDGTWKDVTLYGHRKDVLSAVFSPVGGRIVTASEDHTARVWEQGENGVWRSVSLEGHQDGVLLANFSPEGTRVVTASRDHTARVWTQGENDIWRSVILKGHKDSVFSARFSPDGSQIVTSSLDKTYRVWSEKNGHWRSVSLEGLQGALIRAAFSPDGARIITAAGKTALVWNRDRNGNWTSVALKGHQGTITSGSFSSDGTLIVTASEDKSIIVWSQDKGRNWAGLALKGHRTSVDSAFFSPDGSRILSSSQSEARLWRRGVDGSWSGLVLGGSQDSVNAKLSAKAFSPDRTRIFTASEEGNLCMWSREEDGAWTSIVIGTESQSPVRSAVFSRDNANVTISLANRTTRTLNVRWLKGPGDWAKAEPLSLPETVCREKLHGSRVTVKDQNTGRQVEHIAERLLTADDIKAAPILAGREGEDVCAPFLDHRPWWSRLAFWR